jgi:hypothetical protein
MTTPNTSATGGYIVPTASFNATADAAFDAILAGLAAGITGLPVNLVRPRWQATPPPQPEASVDWCAIGVTDESGDGSIDLVHRSILPSTATPADPTGDGYTTSYEVVEQTVMASFYGPAAWSNGNRFRVGLAIPQNREALILQDITLKLVPKRVTPFFETLNSITYRRCDVEFVLRRTITRTWPIENIQKAQGTIKSQTGSEPFETPASVDPLEE